MPAGTKITPESVVDIRKLQDGRTVWLENGSDAAGLQHIYKRHEVDFTNKGILRDEIPTVVMNALERGKIVGEKGTWRKGDGFICWIYLASLSRPE